MNEIKRFASSKLADVRSDRFNGKFGLQRNEAVQRKNRVIKIACAGTILETAIGILLALNKAANQIR